MEISQDMIEFYLSHVLDLAIAIHGAPPDKLKGYDRHIAEMAEKASRNGELDILRRGLEHILCTAEIEAAKLSHSDYSWPEKEVRQVLAYIRKQVWPSAGEIDQAEAATCSLVTQSLAAWRQREPEEI